MNMNEEEAKQHARLCKEIEVEFGMTSEQFFEALHLAVVLGRLEKIKQMKGTK